MKQLIVIEPHMNGLEKDGLEDTMTVGEMIDMLLQYPKDTKICLSTTDSLYYASFNSGSISTEYLEDTKEENNVKR